MNRVGAVWRGAGGGAGWVVAGVGALALQGCAVATIAGAAAGAAISVGGAVVSTGVKVTGKVIEKAVDVAGDAAREGAVARSLPSPDPLPQPPALPTPPTPTPPTTPVQ
jgi:hypothetical protein